MNVGHVIAILVEESGRYDLVDTEGVPSSRAYFIVNAAQKLLDGYFGHPKEDAWLIKTVAAEQALITFAGARYVQGVFHNGATVKWWPAFHDHETEEAHWPLKAIEVTPAETERELHIRASWKSTELTDADDVSFWTVQEPELLVVASQYQMEVHHKNTQGQNDFFAPIQIRLRNLYNDMMREKMAGPPDAWRIGV